MAYEITNKQMEYALTTEFVDYMGHYVSMARREYWSLFEEAEDSPEACARRAIVGRFIIAMQKRIADHWKNGGKKVRKWR